MDNELMSSAIETFWDWEAVPTLIEYLRIPNKSPAFDPHWAANGHMAEAVRVLADAAERLLATTSGATVEVIQLGDRTPVIFIDIPGTAPGADKSEPVVFYGHLDKQPEIGGWSEGMGPWTPVLKDGKLYGRGSADDGYAIFCALGAILAVDAQERPRGRCIVLVEASEESGSYDLPAYIEHLKPRLDSSSVVVCLDSGCGDYERLWLTTSLRGSLSGTLTVKVLDKGVHSGFASGIVPSSFRILRSLLSRLENERTGEILPSCLHAPIPPERVDQAKTAANILGDGVWSNFPFASGTGPIADDGAELLLNRTWRPALSVIGLEGAPRPSEAGNVLRPFTAARMSVRLPPGVDPQEARRELQALLVRNPPYGAQVTCEVDKAVSGWNARPLALWLETALEKASQQAFGKSLAMIGEGGTIPLAPMLAKLFPTSELVVTGVLGPNSNAHGPDEFLHLAMVKGLTIAMAELITAQAAQVSGSSKSPEEAPAHAVAMGDLPAG